MLRLPNTALAADAARKLKQYQRDVDQFVLYSDRVAASKKKFSQYNRSTNQTFINVRKSLAQMCSAPQRCGYCEDSYADEIEHIRPKELYPEQVFCWKNYVYVCGRCNITKLNRFAVFPPNSDDLINVTRGKNDPVIEPIFGNYCFIDPRQEHARDYMELDLVDTYFFVATGALGGRDWRRADYTIRILGLNNRDALVQARRSAYGSYRARLNEYHTKKLRGANDAELALLANGIASLGHPTVWHEMKRQHQLHPELTGLFNHVPEALGW